MKIYTKEALISELKKIREKGWIKSQRKISHGNVGNTLEDLLDIEENNLPIPNTAEWELKCQREGTSSLTTLLHLEPSPKAIKFVSRILLPKYGWKHKDAGGKHPENEMSFRQTISCHNYSDRGFRVELNRKQRKIEIVFNFKKVDDKHFYWLKSVEKRVGKSNLNPQPYWGFDDIFYKVGAKLNNCFYIEAETKREKKTEFFKYKTIYQLRGLSLNKFLDCIDKRFVFVDFDARTGHNHGTKFRFRNNQLPLLYKNVKKI